MEGWKICVAEPDIQLSRTFEEDFLRFVTDRIMALGRLMPGCGAERYELYTAEHSRLYDLIFERLDEPGRELFKEFDEVCSVLAGFDSDSAYTQGFYDGIKFMEMFKDGGVRKSLKGAAAKNNK